MESRSIRPRARALWAHFGLAIAPFLVLVALDLSRVFGVGRSADVSYDVLRVIVLVANVLLFLALAGFAYWTWRRSAIDRVDINPSSIVRTPAIGPAIELDRTQVGEILLATDVARGSNSPFRPKTTTVYLVAIARDGSRLLRLESEPWPRDALWPIAQTLAKEPTILADPITLERLRAMYPAAVSWREANPTLMSLVIVGIALGIVALAWAPLAGLLTS